MSVKGTYNHCPSVLFFASPDHAPVGHPIALTSSVSDANGDTLSYAWTATGGDVLQHQFFEHHVPVHHERRRHHQVDGRLTGRARPRHPDRSSASPPMAAPRTAPGNRGPIRNGRPSRSRRQPERRNGGSTARRERRNRRNGSGSGGTTGSGGRGGTTGGANGGATGTGGTGGGGACRETDPPAGIAAACAECLDANDNPTTDGCCQISDAIRIAALPGGLGLREGECVHRHCGRDPLLLRDAPGDL